MDFSNSNIKHAYVYKGYQVYEYVKENKYNLFIRIGNGKYLSSEFCPLDDKVICLASIIVDMNRKIDTFINNKKKQDKK